LHICDCGLSPRICGFKKTVSWPPLQIYSGAWGKLIHEKNLKSKISWHCPFKLSFAYTELYKVKTADTRCHSFFFFFFYLPQATRHHRLARAQKKHFQIFFFTQ
jgi:hypothetical protein